MRTPEELALRFTALFNAQRDAGRKITTTEALSSLVAEEVAAEREACVQIVLRPRDTPFMDPKPLVVRLAEEIRARRPS